ncbi:zinc finger BED domain-containing protein DAYSLEEPER-like [Bidens hawaiensis]|uniref:zinc finger BED domain-containing protein DAYSLEEPER-like n=1 Tax=Bidens hawaiensis TaxID=980011 RepID=UPI00404993D7
MDNPANNNEHSIVKTRPKKSMVWEHFTIETVHADGPKARCMLCKGLFAYKKSSGTSHLKRHITEKICPVIRMNEKTDQIIPRKRRKRASKPKGSNFNEDEFKQDIAKMVIMHGYPLDTIQCPAFFNCLKSLQPEITILPLEAVEHECLTLYQRERQALFDMVRSCTGRVSLSLEYRATDQGVGYVFITGRFVDNDWKMHRKILSVVLLPFPDSVSGFDHAVCSCVNDWNLENKLLAVTVDESFANKDVRKSLTSRLSVKNSLNFDDSLSLNGKFLIGSCYARVLCRLAQDALGVLSETVKKVRDSVKYVVTVKSCEERFNELKVQLQVPSAKSLVLDDQSQWNTTYHMLVAASELKEVFSCLDALDQNYQNTLTMAEWKQVDVLCKSLKLLLDAADVLTGPTYPTANVFFHEAWKIQLELKHALVDKDPFVRELTRSMHERFDIYWKDCFLVLSIAVVMDPRFKMKLVEFSFDRLYGQDAGQWIKAVNDGVHELFLHYVVQTLPPPTFVDNETEGLKPGAQENEIFSDFDVFISGYANMKPELDQYLEESVLPRMQEFDVLGWWKLNRRMYPTLSKLACDVLSIPVSTSFQDSVFDVTSKKMDRYRCSLKPAIVEALVCAKDWMQHGSS